MQKRMLCILFLVCCFFGTVTPVWADTPYRSYDKTEWSVQLAAPDAYEPVQTVSGEQAGSGGFLTPSDFAFDSEGRLFIADTGNCRIVILDRDMNFVKEITTVTSQNGETQQLLAPASVFVTEDGVIYLADTDAARCLAITEDGKILQEFLKPEDQTFTSEIFSPFKIMVDSNDMVYVISQNVFQGIMLYDAKGTFQGYYGSPSVDPSFRLLLDRFWKSVLSKEQRETLARYVPVEYSNCCLDEQGFVYATLSYTDSNRQQIRRLNYLGNNIFPYVDNFGEDEVFDYKQERWYTKFTGVAAENDFVYALDAQWQRVYLFDKEGNRLAVFGTQGEQAGSFRSVQAILVKDRSVYVLDRLKQNITVFEPTEYGSLILDAVTLYNQGQYQEAIEPWQKVLAMDANNQMAYSGIGEALLKAEDYKGAVHNFRLAYNYERESVAFEYYRAQLLREHIGIVVIVMLLVVVALLLFTNRRFLGFLSRRRKAAHEKRRARE